MGTLKALRLTGTRISQASTPPLFRSITLVPHTTSFANLLALSRTKLARHVHEIVYDVRMLSSIPDIKMAFEANEFSLVGDSMDASRRKVFALLDEYEEKAFNSVETTEIEVSHLLEILPALPNLEHVRIVSGSLCELPYFYRTLKESMSITSDYYFETSNQSGHHARSVLLCLGALEIRIPKLSFIAVDWSEVVLFSELRTPARYLTMLQRVLRRLPKESLPLPMFSFLYTGEKADRGASLDDLLPVIGTVLDNVHDLTLSMATSRSERQLFLPTGPSFPLSPDLLCASLACIFGCMQTIGHLGPRSLRCLTLSSFVMQQAFLEDFLSGCGDTLAELTIGDLRLFTPYRSQQMVGESCLVDVLDMFSTHMKCLKSVELHGRFYNGGSQDWLVNGTKNKGTLKADVERWTVERGVCPLESERLIGGFQGTRAGDASFKIFRRTLEENPDGELDYDFPPTSENELLSAW